MKNSFAKKSNKGGEEPPFSNGKQSFRLNLIFLLCINFIFILCTYWWWYDVANPAIIGASPVWLGHYGPPIGLTLLSTGVLVFSLLERVVIGDEGISSRLMKQKGKESWCWNNIEKIEYAPLVSYTATDGTVMRFLKKVIVKKKDGKVKTVYPILWKNGKQLCRTIHEYAVQNNIEESFQ